MTAPISPTRASAVVMAAGGPRTIPTIRRMRLLDPLSAPSVAPSNTSPSPTSGKRTPPKACALAPGAHPRAFGRMGIIEKLLARHRPPRIDLFEILRRKRPIAIRQIKLLQHPRQQTAQRPAIQLRFGQLRI